MRYDLTNTILYNEKDVYYKINSCSNNRISIEQIKKPSENSGFSLMRLEDMKDGRLNIVYENAKKK